MYGNGRFKVSYADLKFTSDVTIAFLLQNDIKKLLPVDIGKIRI